MTLPKQWPSAAGLAVGFMADRVFGDPRRGHPVAGILVGGPVLCGSADCRRGAHRRPGRNRDRVGRNARTTDLGSFLGHRHDDSGGHLGRPRRPFIES